jgi:hypothetical protein
MSTADDIREIKDSIKAVNSDIVELKVDLATYMASTKANEQRIELMETFAKTALEAQQSNFKDMLRSNKDHQNALNKQLKLTIGIVTAIAGLITATGVWVAKGDDASAAYATTQVEQAKQP